MLKLIGIIALVVAGVWINKQVEGAGGWNRALVALSTDASCEPVKVETDRHIYKDQNGDPDFGYQITVSLKNPKKAGKVWLQTDLYTQEGTWTKRHTLDMPENTTKAWLIDFPEPTIASEAGEIHAHALCGP
jgi:hypothetical protein